MTTLALVEAVMIGAGNRAIWSYGPYALQHPDEIRFIAVAEPDAARRARFATQHNIPAEMQFASWEELVARPQLARAAVNCTQDRMHHASTLALLRAGYDVLLEKPIAPSRDECIALVEAAEQLGRMLQICHVLRYTAFFTALYDIVNSGRLGRIVTIDHRENVSYWHMSHSFVRGNWRNEAHSSPMILAKCCHDLDILVWVMGRRVTRLSSFGSLMHYRIERVAELSDRPIPPRCTDGCPIEATCPWYAPRLYDADIYRRSKLEPFETLGFMLTAADMSHTSPEERWEKLKTSPYGRCVYHCDNDVVDHQTLNLEFEGGATCTFTMHGHSDREGRTMRWDGTRATLYGDFSEGRPHTLRIVDHGSLREEVIHPSTGAGGHGGGDFGLMRDFVKALNGEHTKHQTTARVSLESHLLAFAAEEARKHGCVVTMA
ncbi:MAG: Gfo/Idh/MocA family oxidoreductase [Thermoflexales bacterium]|nr:Gfo/Idh/MocA family oxidoreductase [Thermoflexales bacterium]MDW8350878.1 Gfo/Idh/MocA family oxidoreductase [Anaerolineae bacterium]